MNHLKIWVEKAIAGVCRMLLTIMTDVKFVYNVPAGIPEDSGRALTR
jgi:hypothetical protein